MTTPFTTAELSDIRRFAGYPVTAGLIGQPLSVQGNSVTLDGILALLTVDQIATVRSVYLSALYAIESGISGSTATLDVDKAAVYTRNANELTDRENLFQSWRLKLCYFFGIAPGAGVYAEAGSSSVTPVAFTV